MTRKDARTVLRYARKAHRDLCYRRIYDLELRIYGQAVSEYQTDVRPGHKCRPRRH